MIGRCEYAILVILCGFHMVNSAEMCSIAQSFSFSPFNSIMDRWQSINDSYILFIGALWSVHLNLARIFPRQYHRRHVKIQFGL